MCFRLQQQYKDLKKCDMSAEHVRKKQRQAPFIRIYIVTVFYSLFSQNGRDVNLLVDQQNLSVKIIVLNNTFSNYAMEQLATYVARHNKGRCAQLFLHLAR